MAASHLQALGQLPAKSWREPLAKNGDKGSTSGWDRAEPPRLRPENSPLSSDHCRF